MSLFSTMVKMCVIVSAMRNQQPSRLICTTCVCVCKYVYICICVRCCGDQRLHDSHRSQPAAAGLWFWKCVLLHATRAEWVSERHAARNSMRGQKALLLYVTLFSLSHTPTCVWLLATTTLLRWIKARRVCEWKLYVVWSTATANLPL